jgi:hypothetical protein
MKNELIIPFRIRVGVTGHRKLDDPEMLSQRISQVLENDIFNLFDEESIKDISRVSKTPVAYTILTPLAEGADRLVAREALKLPFSRIEVVLPLVKEDYLLDFTSTQSKKEFQELLLKARRPIALRDKIISADTAVDDPEKERRQAYRKVGEYVVDNSDVVVALWDEKKSKKKGGTADIVEYAKKRRRPLIIISTITGKIITSKGYGLNAGALKGIEEFNSFPVSEKNRLDHINKVYSETFDNPEGQKIPEERKRIIKEFLLPFYAQASEIAKKFKKIYLRTGLTVYLLSAMAVAAVAFAAVAHKAAYIAFGVELVFLLVILLLVSKAHRKSSHRRWIENRFLTERIRSSIFFAVCDIEVSPMDIPPYLGIAHEYGDWMLNVFNEIWNRIPPMKGLDKKQSPSLLNFIRKHWIMDQINFHKKRKSGYSKINSLLEWAGIATFIIAVTAAALHFIFLFPEEIVHAAWAEKPLTFMAILFPALGATIGGIRTHREFSRLEKRSKNMESVLTVMNDRFSRAQGSGDFESLLREAEKLMLRETQGWLMLMRFTELKNVA